MRKADANLLHAADLKLVRRLRRGDDTAFREFFDEHYERLYRFALGRLRGDEAAAEDVTQRTLGKALRKLHAYKGEARLLTWLCAICRNDIADWYRAHQRYEQRVVLAEDLPGVRAAMESFTAPELDEPAAQAQRAEALRRIDVARDQLPARYGNALEWKYVEGYTSREIAERLGIGYEAAQSLLARARRAFAEVYAELNDATLAAPRG